MHLFNNGIEGPGTGKAIPGSDFWHSQRTAPLATLSIRAARGAGQHRDILPPEACPRVSPVGSLTACFLFCLLLFSQSPCNVDLINTTRRFAHHAYYRIDILPMARRQGTRTLASGIFLLTMRLACTVPLVGALTFASTDVSSRKPCGTCETVFGAPTYYSCLLFAGGKSGNPPTQADTQGLASLPCLEGQGSYAWYDNPFPHTRKHR